MKLLTKTTLYYITVSLFIFFICGVGIYQLVIRLEDRKVRQELTDQMYRFSHDLKQLNTDLRSATIISGGLIEIKHVHEIKHQKAQFTDTLVFDMVRNSYVPYKKLLFYLEIDNTLYETSIYKSLIESNYLIEQIALIITSIVIVFLLAVFFLYRYFFGRIWADFFETIDKIQRFDIASPEKLDFSESMIIEFNELNDVLKKMINRINSDYEGLKDFTGNLTHEIQTPLAVIRSKTDLLMQDNNISENQLRLTGEINSETMRLSKLIKVLTLFTKLEHNQYPDTVDVDIEQITNEKLELFEDFIIAKELSVTRVANKVPVLKMNPELVDILVNNLIKNAIRHNIQGGAIDIKLSADKFLIKNTGDELNFEPDLLFERFSKASGNSKSLGIGLSIVKKICEHYSFDINYSYKDRMHEITLGFEGQ